MPYTVVEAVVEGSFAPDYDTGVFQSCWPFAANLWFIAVAIGFPSSYCWPFGLLAIRFALWGGNFWEWSDTQPLCRSMVQLPERYGPGITLRSGTAGTTATAVTTRYMSLDGKLNWILAKLDLARRSLLSLVTLYTVERTFLLSANLQPHCL